MACIPSCVEVASAALLGFPALPGSGQKQGAAPPGVSYPSRKERLGRISANPSGCDILELRECSGRGRTHSGTPVAVTSVTHGYAWSGGRCFSCLR